MDYKRTPEFWDEHLLWSGEELARVYGGDGAHWRRAKRNLQPEPEVEGVRRGIAVFDFHHPQHDKALWRNILRFTEDFQPDIWLWGGDNEDFETVSHWVGNKRLRVEGKRLKKDYAAFNRDALDPLAAILPDECEKVLLKGNHEKWVEQYIEEHPEMEGLIEIEEHLHLDGYKVLDYGETHKTGHLYWTHGTYINIHNAYKTAQVYGRSIAYGHGHSLQCHTLVTPLDSLPYAATQIPCACNLNPHYRKNQPNAWVNGFAVFYIQPDGRFNLYPVVAIDGVFTAPNGVTYE